MEIEFNTISQQELKSIGMQAASNAVEYFKSINITIEKDMTNFYVLTSAGFVRIGNTDTTPVYDGIEEVLGSRLSRATLLPVHTGMWKELVFDFYKLIHGTEPSDKEWDIIKEVAKEAGVIE